MRLSHFDVRIAIRSFGRHRTFSVVAVLSLGLAIALNTTMYSVLDAMLNPRVDVLHPEQLYYLQVWGDPKGKVSLQERADVLRSGSAVLAGLTSLVPVSGERALLENDHGRRRGTVAYASPNIFRVLGTEPSAGRAFVDADYTDPSWPIVISTATARVLFPHGESPVGKAIAVDGVSHPIIGVVDRASQVPGSLYDVWMMPPPTTPLSALPANIVRIRTGLSLRQAAPMIQQLSQRFGILARNRGAGFLLKPIEFRQFHFGQFHFALTGAVLAVLLIACVNLANLQLARGLGRSRELALRTALGATRRDIIAQLLLESGLLAVAGLGVALAVTVWGNRLLEAHIPPSVADYVVAPQTSWRMFAFGIVACVVCIVVIGLLPALYVSRADPNELLKSGAGTGASARNRRKYSLMIMVEMGLALAVLSGTALVVRSATVFNTLDLGYDMRPLSRVRLFNRTPRDVAQDGHVSYLVHTPARHYIDVQNEILGRLQSVPGVTAAAVEMGGYMNGVTAVDTGRDKRSYPAPRNGYTVVSPGYLRTMGIPIVQGRDFTDGVASEGEMIIDDSTAKFLWPDGSAIGAHIKLGNDSSHAPWIRVVGVAKAVRRLNLASLDNPMDPIPHGLGALYYRPAERDTFVVGKYGYYVAGVARAGLHPEHIPVALRRTLGNFPPYMLWDAESMEDALGLSEIRESHNFIARVFMLFTALALGLASLGIYGVVSHSVAERRRELGVRIALGADARLVLRAVLREGNAVALGGVALGLLFTKYTMRWLTAFSFYGDQYDAPLFAVMAAVLFLVAVAAALVPAMRATQIDPVEALRAE